MEKKKEAELAMIMEALEKPQMFAKLKREDEK